MVQVLLKLNAEQQAAVDAPPGVLLVLAGAGTGKTRTLTARFARLVAAGCPPERMMLVTFTNRAAREMVHRVERQLGIDLRGCAAGTFHHVGHRLLRAHGVALGFNEDFGILDPEDCRELVDSVVNDLGYEVLDPKHFPTPKRIAIMVSQASGAICTVREIVERRYPNFLEARSMIDEVATGFVERKRKLNLMDFDDLLGLWLTLLRDPAHVEIGDQLRAAYDHLLVDEYQDINTLQGALISEMSRQHGSLTCVGDDAQSIYAFRGADFAQVFEFMGLHPSAEVLPLTVNYRSTPEIIALANRSITRNIEQHPKQLVTVRDSGTTPAVVMVMDVMQQAEFVVQRALELHYEEGIPLSKIAILYRNHVHSLEVQVELTRHDVPFSASSGVRFFEQAHIKDVLAFLRVRMNPKDGLAWLRVLRLWLGLGMSDCESLAVTLAAWEDGSARERLERLSVLVAGRNTEGLRQIFVALDEPETDAPSKAIRLVLALGALRYAPWVFGTLDACTQDINRLATFAERWTESREFLSEVTLSGNASSFLTSGPNEKIVLSTIHQAKGLEWSAVFVLWVNEGRLPSGQAMQTPATLEEERRLFYVATTRAADHLYLVFPTLMPRGNGACKLMRPSRFLIELDREPPVCEHWELEAVEYTEE